MTWSPREAFIVSHTHWDREWYLTFDEFRVDMARTVDRVLDALESGALPHFLLDGQAVLLDDYIEMRPHEADRVRRLANEGKLAVGPWFILPDEFLVSGESTARNLLFGHRTAARYGAVHEAGYMPDSFGHLAQIPQILQRAGLKSFIFTRGLGDEAPELGWRFRWQAPDGSEVLAINQAKGYCNAGGLGFEEIWHAHTRREVDLKRAVEQVREVFDVMAERPGAEPALLNNGCDHFPPQRDYHTIVDALRTAYPDTTFTPTDMPTFIEAASVDQESLPLHSGELLGGRDHHILSGVWSARMPLKQANERCETLLSLVSEPVASMLHILHGEPYPGGELDTAWRKLLENQPHDSICGCSVDGVHSDMVVRFDKVERTGRRVVSNALEILTPHFARHADGDRETMISVTNPLPERRREIVTRLVVLQPFIDNPELLRLYDDEGREVPFTVLDTQYVERFWGIDYRRHLCAADQHEAFAPYREHFAARILKDGPGDREHDCHWTIQFSADLPPCGHVVYSLREGEAESAPAPDGNVIAGDGRLENDMVSVQLHTDGRFDLTDKRSGVKYEGLNAWRDDPDAGDEYDWCHGNVPGDNHPHVETGCLFTIGNSGLQASVEAEFAIRLPSRLTPDRTRREIATVDCPVRVRLTLHHDSPRVDVRTTVVNQAEDHRLRVLFPTPHATNTLVSDGHFYVHERPLVRSGGKDWTQPPPTTWPQQGFSCVQSNKGGLAVLNRGLPEVEGSQDEHGAALAVTLLRCVGWLSRDDFPSRRNSNAGPTLFTPDAQCLGEHVFDYAVFPYNDDWLTADVAGESRRWRVPPLTMQGVNDLHRPGDWLLEQPSPNIVVTAIKQCADRDTLIVRLNNIATAPEAGSLRLGRPPTAAWIVSLLESRGEPVTLNDNSIPVELGAHEILTLEIQF